jgi:hypothetical protein
VLRRGADACRLLLRDGRVNTANVESRSEPAGAECVYSLLGWTEGHFEFSPRPVEGEDTVGASTTSLLMEGARRLDETSAAG